MDKQRRDRKTQRMDSMDHYAGMAENKPDKKAEERFRRPAYQVTDVIGYMERKYDIKGEIGSADRSEQHEDGK